MVNNKKKRRNKKKMDAKFPFVSVCTPTFNRRPFINSIIKVFQNQTYPKDRMEWIIIDDGSDKIEDLVKDVPCVKYFKYDDKLTLGKKRNLMHDKSIGDIIVYMDDDDYYPPERVSHAVDILTSNKNTLCAGSSEIYIYFNHINKVYQFGPYGPNHATAGTFAFKRELLKITRYNEEACLAEEKEFLKNYTIPFSQLNPTKTILVFSHEQNTFDKKKLLTNAPNKYVKEATYSLEMLVKDKELREFYSNTIHERLKDYKEGDISMKPDVIKQTKEIEERRKKMNDENQNNQVITITHNTGRQKNYNINELGIFINNLQNHINNLQKQNNSLQNQINSLQLEYKNTKIHNLNNENVN